MSKEYNMCVIILKFQELANAKAQKTKKNPHTHINQIQR